MTMKTPFIKMQNKSYVLEGLGTAINGKHLCPQVHLMQYRGNILSEKPMLNKMYCGALVKFCSFLTFQGSLGIIETTVLCKCHQDLITELKQFLPSIIKLQIWTWVEYPIIATKFLRRPAPNSIAKMTPGITYHPTDYLVQVTPYEQTVCQGTVGCTMLPISLHEQL